jgi:hypothetical protein
MYCSKMGLKRKEERIHAKLSKKNSNVKLYMIERNGKEKN